MRYTIRQRWINLLGSVADRPVPSAVVATVLLALVASLIRAPVIDGSLVDQMSGTNARLEIAQRITQASGGESTVAVIVVPGDATIAATFSSLTALERRLRTLDEGIALRSIHAVQDQLFLFDLAPQAPISELLAALRDTAQSSTIISSSGSRFLLVVTFPEAAELDVLGALSAHNWSGVFTEHTVLASAQLEQDVAAGLRKDLRLLMPVIVAATLVALFIAFGCWRALLLPLFASVASTVVTFALFSTSVVTINLVTLLALPIVLIVGLANSCHFLAQAKTGSGAHDDVEMVVRVTLQRVGPPFFFSTLTTSIALASLGFNELPPIANLGLLSAAALLIVFTLVLLAAPLSLRWYLHGSGGSWQDSSQFARLSLWLVNWRSHVSAVLLLAMVAGAATIPLLTVKSAPRAFFPDNAPFPAALEVFEEEFYVFSPLRILLTTNGTEPIAALGRAGALRDALADHPGVRRVTMQPATDQPGAYVLSALLSDDAALASVRELLDSKGQGADSDIVYSNASLVYGDIDRQATESLLRSLGWSVALIFGALLLVFRSFRVMLSAMLANAVPLMLVCGAVWLIGQPLNLVTVFVFLVALGVIVDDSIHILFSRAAGDRISGSSIEFSVLLSTLILCLGMLLCQLSDFPTTRQFAAYCALALVGAVVSNLSVLPLMLRAPAHVREAP